MIPELYADILAQHGFGLIGRLDYRVHLTAWWNPAADRKVQVICLSVGRTVLLKADKSYYLQSVSAEGETWARDLGLLQDYLESHFPELRLSFSHFRDVPAALAETEVRRRLAVEAPTQPIPTVEQIAQLQRQLDQRERTIKSMNHLMSLSGDSSDLLSSYVHQQTRSSQDQIDQLKEKINRQQERHDLLHHLQREYQSKGSAAVYQFSISSNLQVAADPEQFRDALQGVIKELVDLHRYQVSQKLGGARLNVQVAEADQPVLTWIEQWLGGALTPHQLHKLGPEFTMLRQAADAHTMVVPKEDIRVDGHVRHPAKHVAAKFVSTVFHRLDKTEDAGHKRIPETVPAEQLPLTIGQIVDESGRMIRPALLPLAQMTHAYVSGITGSGKSFLARVLIEEASRYPQLSILILDPRNQAIGLLAPEDRPEVLGRYGEFGMKDRQARRLEFAYHAPSYAWAAPIPDDLASLVNGRSIVSFKELSDGERCLLVSRILSAVFDACAKQESQQVRLLLVVDEAQLFTRKRVDESAKQAAEQAERALDRIAREGRKYGLCLVLVSQTIKDFAYESASIRQNTNTKLFLRNADREIEYAADFIGDGRQLVNLPAGVALVHNAAWGVLRVRVRPPYSKAYEFSESDSRRLAGMNSKDSEIALTHDARSMLNVIRQHLGDPASPLNLSKLATLCGITSKRRLLELVDELERAGAIRTRKLPQRGQPRVIECDNLSSTEDPDAMWTGSDKIA